MRQSLVSLAIVLGFAAASGSAAGADPENYPPLDLATLLAEAEAHHPEILAARSRAEAASHVAHQVAAPMDPRVSIAYTNDGFEEWTLGESTDAGLAFTWEQEVRYPGKRGLAARVAREEGRAKAAEAERTRSSVGERVIHLYLELYRFDRTLAILEESRQALISLAAAARARYESGEGIQESVLSAQTEISRFEAEVEHTRRLRRQAAIALSAAVGREFVAVGPANALPDVAPGEDLQALAAEAVLGAPEVIELKARLSKMESSRSLARLETKPDFSWTAAYHNRGGLDPLVSGGLGVRLPLYRQRRQLRGVAQAEADLEAARHDLAAAELRARAQAQDLADEARHAGSLARRYEQVVIPQAMSTLDAGRAAYGVGKAELSLLLRDAERVLSYRILEVTERVHRLQAIASLEAIAGRPLLEIPGRRIS